MKHLAKTEGNLKILPKGRLWLPHPILKEKKFMATNLRSIQREVLILYTKRNLIIIIDLILVRVLGVDKLDTYPMNVHKEETLPFKRSKKSSTRKKMTAKTLNILIQMKERSCLVSFNVFFSHQ